MENTEVLIIGAGASGLMAAYQLAKAGKKVIVLEARNRTGGRIHTLDDSSFFKLAELGAEFIHGNLPVTSSLLKEAGIEALPADAEMWQYQNGEFKKSGQFIDKWDEFIERLNKLEQDLPMQDFLEREFPGDQYQKLRTSVWNYVSGYDTADPRKASAFASRKEWENEDENAQHRVSGGYCAMIGYFSRQVKQKGGSVFLNAVVKKINWQAGQVEAITVDGSVYKASKVVIALPLGVLQAAEAEQGAISFSPGIPDQHAAIQQMGFGAVVKILLEFDEAFWDNDKRNHGSDLSAMGYLFSDEKIPTWWTQYPSRGTVLTGWIGGPAAHEKLHHTDEEVLNDSLQSVANIFSFDVAALKDKLIAWKVVNWTADPFTRGAYAYDTVAAPAARQVLSTPVQNTIYFTGEYLYDGTAMGTVEAALTSGKSVAGRVL